MNDVYYFRPHTGQDPELLGMQAHFYHDRVVVLPYQPTARDSFVGHRVPDGATPFGALWVTLWCAVAYCCRYRFAALAAVLLVTTVVTFGNTLTISGGGGTGAVSFALDEYYDSVNNNYIDNLDVTPNLIGSNTYDGSGNFLGHTIVTLCVMGVSGNGVVPGDFTYGQLYASSDRASAPVTNYWSHTYGHGSWVFVGLFTYDQVTTLSNHTYAWIQMSQPDPHHVFITLPQNGGAVDVTYNVVDSTTGETLGTFVQHPGDGVSSHSVSTGSNPVHVTQSTTGAVIDGNSGVWTTSASGVVIQSTGPDITPTSGSTPATGETPLPINPSPDLPPTNGSTPNSGKGLWTPTTPQTAGTQTDLLTISAYREGVDKLLNALNDSGGGDIAQQTFPDPSSVTPGVTLPTPSTFRSSLASKLPSAPAMDSLDNVSTIGITFDIPKINGDTLVHVSKSVDFSQPPYSTPISIFRGLCLAVLTLTFFLATFFTIRGMFGK